jgi:hypothetical protein
MKHRSEWPVELRALLVCCGLVLADRCCLGPAEAVGVNYLSGKALGVSIHLIQVDPRLPNVRISPGVCPRFPQGKEDFQSFLARTRPRAAITAAPVDVHLGRPPIDILIGGRLVNQGPRGTVALFGEAGQIQLQRIAPDGTRAWGSCPAALGGGPKLLTRGGIDIQVQEEGFLDPADLREVPHTALGLTAEGLLLLVQVREPVDLFQLAAIMKRLGCVEAMNLWSGEDCGLAYDGQILSDPGRPITHALLVYDDLQAYQAAQPELLPSVSPAVGPPGPRAPGPSPGRAPIRIVQPVEGVLITTPVLVRAVIQPQPEKTYVGFYIDGEFCSASNVPPYDFRFDPCRFEEGEHTLEARLYTQNWELLGQDRITLKVGRSPQEGDGPAR